ncbi:mediator of RNA polymerase II transcription subunit 20 [Eurytemora carolleeae]|uniref:mediator of RNA polymerase II transcription subunit 20 n=1 Tax=Eurytemora carolleeae TaxID=1294199 RepID=UPI000C78591B|nr:mediator of RNA polymerase II transcription subunit 20 [Eurytemora carolleeae]|eukprot:XP_023344346.1 mediator of RNA polymerase II transcription subunit 20-like [Eurytemora affinis]
MGVAVLQSYPVPSDKTGQQVIETLTRRIMNLGASPAGQFVVDCEVYNSLPHLGQNKNLYILHNSEYPATVFSVIESQNKTVSITTDSLFDLLMLKLSTGNQYYSKKIKIESKGPRFEIKDFLVKLGSVTIGGTVKGILVEVDYLPGIIPGTCWGLLAEFMQGFLGSCVSVVPPAYIKSKATEAFSPVDTVQQYLEQFNLARKNTR